MSYYAAVMSGGKGTRFWPLSRKNSPKQFLNLNVDSDLSMIQETIDRIPSMIPRKNTFIITNQDQFKLALKHCPTLPKMNIIPECIGRNTAPCIALAALLAYADDPNAIIVAMPADHIIRKKTIFQSAIKKAFDVVKKNKSVVVFGIEPDYPETGFGYIEVAPANKDKRIAPVKNFVEKPNLKNAKSYVKKGTFYWNSGIFVFEAATMLGYIDEFIPELSKKLLPLKSLVGKKSFQKELDKVYPSLPSISIDYGVMERISNVDVIKVNPGWSDLGNFLSLAELYKRDTLNNSSNQKNSIFYNSKNTFMYTSKKKIVTSVGVEDLIVIDTEDAILVVKKSEIQNVKEVQQLIEKNPQFKDYL